jgi:hypothetical protein
MASLEDTFRMMKGKEPVNTNRLSKDDHLRKEMRSKYNGNPSGKITRGFMDSVRNSLIENRGGTVSESPAAAPVKDVKKYRDGLVQVGKVLVASMNAIDFGHESKPHDLNNLIRAEEGLKQLYGALTMFPELRAAIKSRTKFPQHPKRKQRPGP